MTDGVKIGDADVSDLPKNGHELSRATVITTGHPCSECGTAVSAVAGPEDGVDSIAVQMTEDYPVTLDETWRDGYDDAAYLYCDSPVCPWHGVVEYTDLRRILPDWLQEDALTWEERVENGDLPEEVGE